MQKSEKSADQSMEDILASIRKIIAEEPEQTPQKLEAAAVSLANAQELPTQDAAMPPGGDLSDMLDDPAGPIATPVMHQAAEPAPDAVVSEPGFSAPEIQPVKSPFPGADADHESPLMARLRGLAGPPVNSDEAPVVSQDANGLAALDIAKPQLDENGSGEQVERAESLDDSVPSMTPELSIEMSPAAEIAEFGAPSEMQDVHEPKTETPADILAEPDVTAALNDSDSTFGKSAAAGIEPVPISIEVDASGELGADPPIADVAPSAEATPDEETAVQKHDLDDMLRDAAEAQSAPNLSTAGNIFGALSTGPMLDEAVQDEAVQGEDATQSELPMLPHQEVPDSEPEAIVPDPAVAAVSPPEADVVHKPAESNPSPRADLELALAALVEPLVHRWLEDNVPALVEKVLAEQTKDE